MLLVIDILRHHKIFRGIKVLPLYQHHKTIILFYCIFYYSVFCVGFIVINGSESTKPKCTINHIFLFIYRHASCYALGPTWLLDSYLDSCMLEQDLRLTQCSLTMSICMVQLCSLCILAQWQSHFPVSYAQHIMLTEGVLVHSSKY